MIRVEWVILNTVLYRYWKLIHTKCIIQTTTFTVIRVLSIAIVCVFVILMVVICKQVCDVLKYYLSVLNQNLCNEIILFSFCLWLPLSENRSWDSLWLVFWPLNILKFRSGGRNYSRGSVSLSVSPTIHPHPQCLPDSTAPFDMYAEITEWQKTASVY